MGKIKILPPEIAEKIAAGEVISRPAAVVKELIENSLDANAKEIEIEIKEGGEKYIRVSDDGEGMDEEEAKLSLERFATSKISDFEDLFKIDTLGFRGEALPSIAAISRLTLITRNQKSEIGYKIRVEGGKIIEQYPVGAPLGTTVIVEDIFYNTPARRKFLKSENTEKNHIIQIVESNALVNHSVKFLLKIKNKNYLNIPSVDTFSERVIFLFGKEFFEKLVPLHIEIGVIQVEGFISRPEFSFSDKSYQYFFVNKRHISSPLLIHSLYDGYREFLPSNRHPACFIFIKINPELIDINIHPTKREIKFIDEKGIHNLLSSRIREVLLSFESIPSLKQDIDIVSDISREEGIKQALQDFLISGQQEKTFYKPSKFEYKQKQPSISFPAINPLVQWQDKYIIGETKDSLVIIDQHAAWERIFYEKYLSYYEKGEILQQTLLYPLNLELSFSQSVLLEENLNYLKNLGFEIEKISKDFVLKSVPLIMGKEVPVEIIYEIINSLRGIKKEGILDPAGIQSIIKLIACRTSGKAGQSLTSQEMKQLLEDLGRCKNSYRCPHGRPTIINIIGKEELEEKFGRK